MDVSIIVVSYNTRQLTLECLDSIRAQTNKVAYEIIVVDNKSTDGSADAIRERFPEVRLIEPESNLGFAKANNRAAELASGRFLLLLNPDTVVLDSAIDHMVQYASDSPESTILGGRTLYADGSLNPTSCWGRPTLWSTYCFAFGLSPLGRYFSVFDRESMRRWRRDTIRTVDIISGCFLLIEREVWNRLEGFDPKFSMYGEDFDLCIRAKMCGIRCVFLPDAKIIHYGSASETVKADQLVRQMRAKVQLIRKHFSGWARGPGVFFVAMRVLLRARFLRPSGVRRPNSLAWQEAWLRRKEWLVVE